MQYPPSLVAQPTNQTLWPGDTATFTVAAGGTPPFGYSWYFNITNLVQVGVNSTLTLSNVARTDAGNFSVVFTNAFGSVTSRVATLTVLGPPIILIQPLSQITQAGSNVTIVVPVSAPGPAHYQWQFNGSNLANNVLMPVAGSVNPGFAGDGGPALSAKLSVPAGIAFDNGGNMFIADAGNLIVADSLNNAIRSINFAGTIKTIAGTGTAGYFGDGGPADAAQLYWPKGLAADALGNIYIADYHNQRVRKLTPRGIGPTLSLANLSTTYSGNYTVIVTSPYGSVASSVASLTVLAPANITAIAAQPDRSMTLTVASGPYTTNRIWAATNLAPPASWWSIFTNVADSTGAWSFTDTHALSLPALFYRIPTL